MCPKRINQKLYLNGPLTARAIAKVNVLACTNLVLIVANNVLVSVVCTYVINKLFQIKNALVHVIGFDIVNVNVLFQLKDVIIVVIPL